jgi:hypothetical protein
MGAATQPTQPSVTINVSDLTGGQLKTQLQNDAKTAFNFAKEIAQYWNDQVGNIPNNSSGTITISGSGSWKTGGVGIGFSLSASAKCSIAVVNSGPVIKYAPNLSSQATQGLPSAAYAGSAYVVISLDFQISGGASGSGTAAGVGISGNVRGSTDTSVVFSHLVPSTALLGDAVKDALQNFTFALDPACANSMNPGDLSEVNFNGSLALGLSVNYGFPNISFAAPGVASTLDSVTKGAAQFTLPSGKISIGASATVNYTHSDDFTAIVQKIDAANAFLYVMRAHKNDGTEGVSVSATVKITNTPGVTVNSQQLAQAVNGVTGGLGGQLAASQANTVAQGLTSKLNTWINSTVSKGAQLGAQWDQQSAVSMLFMYKIALQSANLTQSWNALCSGNVLAAQSAGGIVPIAGSGISSQLSDSFTANLQFFNFFSATDKTTYFNNSTVTVEPDGDILYNCDIGKENDSSVQKSSKMCKIHFVISVDQSTAGTAKATDVNLEMELSSTNNAGEAGRIASVAGALKNAQGNQTAAQIQQFATSNPSGTVDLTCVLKPSAYGKITCSPYNGNTPPANQDADANNWLFFHDAADSVMGSSVAGIVQPLTYLDWQKYNVLCVHGPGATATPDRRNTGNTSIAGASSANYFLLVSGQFMDVCDYLEQLAAAASNSGQNAQAYDTMLLSLAQVVLADTSTDYSKAAIAALLGLVQPQNVTASAVNGTNSLTCTLTIN